MMADETNTTAPKPESTHLEAPTDVDKIKNGDKALALFDNLDDIHVGFEPGEEKRLVRKIDMMILPFLSVCYAFYYVRHLNPILARRLTCDQDRQNHTIIRSNFWNPGRLEPIRSRVQLAFKRVLLWIFGLEFSNKFVDAKVPYR